MLKIAPSPNSFQNNDPADHRLSPPEISSSAPLSAKVTRWSPYSPVNVDGIDYHFLYFMDFTEVFNVVYFRKDGIKTVVAQAYETQANRGQPNFTCYVERSIDGRLTGAPNEIFRGRKDYDKAPALLLLKGQQPLTGIEFEQLTPFNAKQSREGYERILNVFHQRF